MRGHLKCKGACFFVIKSHSVETCLFIVLYNAAADDHWLLQFAETEDILIVLETCSLFTPFCLEWWGGGLGRGVQLMYHSSDKFAGTPGHFVCHCSGKFMEMASHIITVVASWCQATLLLWWQVYVDVRPHYHCGGKLMLMLMSSHIITVVANWCRCQATLLLWWQTDVDVRPHYHCGGKLMLMSGHIITVVASWCWCQATLLLWWQVDGDVRPHYHCGGNLMEMSGHIITIVAIWWRCQATLSLWWQCLAD